MTKKPLNCPFPQPLFTSSDNFNDLTSLLDYIRRNQPVSERVTFPRGTLMPDGRLDMCKQGLGAVGCSLITEALEGNQTIASLLLGTNGIGDLGAAKVARLIERNHRLEIIYLGCNAIAQTGIADIAQALTHNQSVTGLWLKRNPIGINGAYSIAEMLRYNQSIRTLDLVNTQIGSEGLTAIINVLIQTNKTVNKLYLGGNQIQPNHAFLIADLLRHNPTIQGLFLNVNDLGDPGVKILAAALLENKTLRALGLASNGISAKGCSILLSSIKSHPSLSNLDLGYSPSTKILGAQANLIGDLGVDAIAHFLRDNQTLFRLNLRGTGISDEETNEIFAALEQNQTLGYLILDRIDAKVKLLLERNRLLNLKDKLTDDRDLALIRSVYR
ncbi:ribonuclease inhibitor [Oscillatoriales cyanobacterium USR001]|nr:ribonuclease inhibitor [Oscillatoriales cyanobacterium USR001]